MRTDMILHEPQPGADGVKEFENSTGIGVKVNGALTLRPAR
jgi:hypothetical protein